MNDSTKQINVAIYQPVIPHYRVPLFLALSETPGINLEVFASMKAQGSPATPDMEFPFKFNRIKHKTFLGNRLIWQKGALIPDNFRKGDVIVICGNPRYLSNYMLILKARIKGIGIVWFGHGYNKGHRVLSTFLKRQIMRLSDIVLLYTDQEVDGFIRAEFNPEKLYAVNNTICSSEIERCRLFWNSDRLLKFKKENNIEDRQVLLFCGRLSVKSEFEIILDAFEKVLKSNENVILIMIGDGDKKAELEKKAENMGINKSIKWLGGVFEEEILAPWFLSARCLVYPSAIGLALLHAFSYGLPVLTHSRAEFHGPEFAAMKDGVNGLLFQKGNAEDMADKILKILSNSEQRERLSKEALKKVSGDFSFNEMVKRFIAAIYAAGCGAGLR